MAERKPPIWLLPSAVLASHRRMIAEHRGSDGLRDEGLLESALARPENLFAYGEPDTFDLAASYAVGIAKNHPFVDGNNRTAFMAAYIFLVRNGWRPTMTESDAVVNMVALAAGEMDEGAFAAWLRTNCVRA